MNQQRQLLEPFHQKAIKRVDKGAYKADFVSWTDKLQRLFQLGLDHDWEILSIEAPTNWVQIQVWDKKDKAWVSKWVPVGGSGDPIEPVSCVGRLTVTVDGVKRVEDGVGQGRDAKTASTDAFARACAFVGVGLHLWCQGGDKDGGYWIAGVLDKDASSEA